LAGNWIGIWSKKGFLAIPFPRIGRNFGLRAIAMVLGGGRVLRELAVKKASKSWLQRV